MIRITVELLSAVSRERSKVLCVATITNDGTGTASRGNYTVALSEAERIGKPARGYRPAWLTARLEGWPRNELSPWYLVFTALAMALGPDRVEKAFAAIPKGQRPGTEAA